MAHTKIAIEQIVRLFVDFLYGPHPISLDADGLIRLVIEK